MKKGFFLIVAIVAIVSAFLAVKFYSSKSQKSSSANNIQNLDLAKMNKFLRPVDKNDHIRGNIEAPVKIVEFSDLECPFCKALHPTLKRIVGEYNGKVAWVYRHFPLETHTKARKEAQAAECANKLGGHAAFWNYVDRVFEVTPSNDGLDLALLPQIAKDISLDIVKFNQCLENDTYNQKIAQDLSDAMTSGGRGTPFVVIVGQNKRYDFSGAQPYETVKNLVELALQSK